MTGMDLYEAIGHVDEKYLEQSEKVYRRIDYHTVRKVAYAAVATLVLGIVGISGFYSNSLEESPKNVTQESAGVKEYMSAEKDDSMEEALSFEFSLEGVTYISASADNLLNVEVSDMAQANLQLEDGNSNGEINNDINNDEDEAKAEADSKLVITEDMLGKKIGIISESKFEELIGCEVYECAVPTKEDYCIVKTQKEYLLFEKK